MGTKRRKPATPSESSSASTELELPERWSVQRKAELVLRVLRGEALDAVSRESQVPAHELESWKRIFLEQGTRGLKTRSDPEERVLRLMRGHQLLAPRRLGPPNGDPAHAGTITTTRPDQMW